MKILCLHGKGTSGRILETQTAAFRRRLQALERETHLIFDFVDGALAADPAPAIDQFFKGPFWSFYQSADIDNLRSAHAWLLEVVERQGPYDGVLAFSQGCALAATLMLELQAGVERTEASRHRQQPFRFAIFICGGLPLTYFAGRGYAVSDAAWQYDEQARLALSSQASLNALLQCGSQRWNQQDWTTLDNDKHSSSSHPESPSATTVFGLDLAQVADAHKIQIPTVHVYGSKDPRKGSALQLAGMCRPDITKVACHGGGHDIPRTSEASDLIAKLILWAATETRNTEEN
ncbi:hypothetical protein KCU83_g5357, partial [Aureobasidium melanogenum]